MNKKIYLTLSSILFLVLSSFGQSQYGKIKGQAVDKTSGKGLEYALVVAKLNGIVKGSGYTDEKGNFEIQQLTSGTYSIEVQDINHRPFTVTGITVVANETSIVPVMRIPDISQKLDDVVIKWEEPIIKPTQNTKTIAKQHLEHPSTRNINKIAGTTATAYSNGGTPSFAGSRTDGTRYFVDGVPMIGALTLPQASIDQVNVLQAGVPAQYGDFTGGAISLVTKGPSRFSSGSVEVISSSMFNPYHFNQIEAAYLAPLVIRNKGQVDPENPARSLEHVVLGYTLSGQFNYQADPSPSAIGNYVVKDDVLERLKNDPLVSNPKGTGYVPAASFLTMNDFDKVKARPNVAAWRAILNGKLEYQPTKSTNITFFGSANINKGQIGSFANGLLNYELNPEQTDNTYRAYVRFTQKLGAQGAGEKGAPKKLITNAYYTVRLDWQRRNVETQDARHKDRFFDYGYLGKFTRHQRQFYSPQSHGDNPKVFVDQNGDTVPLRNYWELVGYLDTLYTFERSELNPVRANYTSSFYDLVAARGGKVSNQFDVLQGQGLINGYNSPVLYSLFLNPGAVTANYSKSEDNRYSIFAMGEATINSKKNDKVHHDVQFGLTYEQTVRRGYTLGANGLWFLMPQLVNSHIELDKEHPFLVYDANGAFLDTVKYAYKANAAQQTSIDRNLRNHLISKGAKDVYGNPITETSIIDVNSLSPSDFKLDYFSADELLNNGNGYVSYFGYDYLGKRSKVKPSLNEFLNDKNKRSIGAYAPIYSAVWMQDQFEFRNMIMRLGVRVERFDANQPVLKDPYSLYPIVTKGEVSTLNGNAVDHPDNIGDDYAVYVNNTLNPTKIVGYRKDNKWYDDNGAEQPNPDLIALKSSGGKIQPYLSNPQEQKLTTASFKDYTPQVNVLPRIWFSFPINETSQFFANYDMLAQRPTDAQAFLTIDDYYYMQARAAGAVFANPNLKPRLRTNYEVGFRQALTKKSALAIIASYAEIRNDFNQYRVNHAYPIAYTTYSNIDFATVKGFRAEYEMRGRTLTMTANYMLQFANGTGSNASSAQALIASQQPNLRSLFPLDVDIRHNIKLLMDYRYGRADQMPEGTGAWARKYLSNAGINMILNARSGAPYTATTAPIAMGSVGRAQIKGTPLGSRLPWQTTVDLNIDKSFILKGKVRKDKDGNPVTDPKGNKVYKPIELNVFFWVENVLNAKNVSGVYPFTGLPNDDGYLSSPEGRQNIQGQLSAQAYTDIYKIALNNPANYVLPRQARLGVKLIF